MGMDLLHFLPSMSTQPRTKINRAAPRVDCRAASAAKQLMMRFEGLLGEFSQHDFGEVRITCLDGTQEVVRFFCSRLKWLRWAAVDPVPDQVAQMLIPTLADHADPGDHRRWRCVDMGPRAPAPSRTHGKRRPRRRHRDNEWAAGGTGADAWPMVRIAVTVRELLAAALRATSWRSRHAARSATLARPDYLESTDHRSRIPTRCKVIL